MQDIPGGEGREPGHGQEPADLNRPSGLLGPCARERACTVLRGVGRSNALHLPGTPLLADAARFCRHAPGDRWYVDETYGKVNGVWRYVYRAVEQYGQGVDVLVSGRRGGGAAPRVLRPAPSAVKGAPTQGGTRAAAGYPGVLG